MFKYLLLPLFAFANLETEHHFAGKHFLASYLECNRTALSDIEGLENVLEKAIQASGATILSKAKYIFPPTGVTAVYLLSESHASIHTYPEFGACFVDLFTCGDNCSSIPFNQILQEYLEPETVNARQFLRHATIEDDL